MRARTIMSFAMALCTGLVIASSPRTASAGKDMRMRFGLGGQRTLTGYPQIRARLFPITNLHVGLGFGMLLWDPHEEDVNDDTIVLATISPEVMGWYVSPSEGPISANFGGGLRFGMVFGENGIDDSDEQGLDDPFEIDIELPISAEVFFGHHFSIAPEVGIVFRIVPGEYDDTPGAEDNGDENPGSGCNNSTSPLTCGILSGAGLGRGPGFGFDIGANTGLFGGGSFNFFF
jgi:hypothetical protein